jgi:hypothetical protein
MMGCKQPVEANEELLIPRVTFVEILADAQIFQAFSEMRRDRNKSGIDLAESYKWLLQEYGVTDEAFRYSLHFYAVDQKTFEEIYDEVITRISEKEAAYHELKNIQADSVSL